MVKKKSNKGEEELKNQFYSFQKKINRLQELKRELSSLESRGLTKGFEKEVSIIKSRLKDTSSLPELDRQVKRLRKKIMDKRDVKKKSPIKNIQGRVGKIEDTVLDTNKSLRRAIGAIKGEQDNTNKSLRRVIGNIRGDIRENTNKSLRKAIGTIEGEIKETVYDSNKSLKKELSNIEETIKKRELKKKGKINDEVNFYIDDRFNAFLHDVKIDLSKKLEQEEDKLNDEIRVDLNTRKNDLEIKYKELQDKLKANYDKKVETELEKEIANKFNSQLRKRFEEEKARLDLEYVSKMKEKYHNELIKQKKILSDKLKKRLIDEDNYERDIKDKLSKGAHRELLKEVSIYKNQLKKDIDFKKNELETKYNQIEAKHQAKYKVFEKNLGNKYRGMENKLKGNYDQRVRTQLHKEISKKFSSELKKKFQEEKSRLDREYGSKVKEKYDNELVRQKKILENKLEERMKNAERNESLIKKQIAKESHESMLKSLANYKKQLKKVMDGKFQSRLNEIIVQNEKDHRKEIAEKTEKLNEVISRQMKLNDMLQQNLSSKIYNIEQLKEANSRLLAKISRVRHDQSIKRADEEKALIEKHKNEIQRLTNELKKNYHKKFDSELYNHIIKEKNRLSKEYSQKINEERSKISQMSFNEKRKYKMELRTHFDFLLRKNIDSTRKKLEGQYKSQYESESNSRVSLEKKKLENNLKDLESKFNEKLRELKLREKKLLEDHKTQNLDIASEKRRLLDKMNIFKKEQQNEMDKERIRMQKKFTEESHEKLLKELASREASINSKYKRLFEERLSEYKKHQDEELSKKKAELVRELQSKARDLLG